MRRRGAVPSAQHAAMQIFLRRSSRTARQKKEEVDRDRSRKEDLPRSARWFGLVRAKISPTAVICGHATQGPAANASIRVGGHVPVQRRLVKRPGPPIRRSARISLQKGVSRGRGRGSLWGVNERRVPPPRQSNSSFQFILLGLVEVEAARTRLGGEGGAATLT